jgi:two-component system invasion response regulator UvrY
MRILICDDHQIMRDGLKQILQQLEGVKSIGDAKTGAEAVFCLAKEVFDILLLDISLRTRTDLRF